MEKFKEMIKSTMKEKKLNQQKCGEAIGVDRTTISNTINGKKELRFCHMRKLSQLLTPHNHAILKSACLLYEGVSNIKLSFEFLATNHYFSELETLIEKCNKKGVCGFWPNVYSIVMQLQERNPNYEVIIEEIRLLSANLPISETFLRKLLLVQEAICYHRLREYNSSMRVINMATKQEPDENEFLEKSYTARVNQIKSFLYLHQENNPVKCREYALEIINQDIGDKFVADAYYIIGQSFTFENVGEALHYLDKAAELFKLQGRGEIVEEISLMSRPFLETLHSTNLGNLDIDSAEKAFRLAKRGDKEEAEIVLNQLSASPFRYYYKGLATGRDEFHFKALNDFVNSGNLFYAKLPYEKLRESEVYREVAKLIYEG
ncbi:AimR family lysis-lysogeny pheromone receptor [Terribacillus sp. 179-K 1B1 HS]|uniref:AimR family lysis-lysogeny pheromone receptor n=1 Tax=Terribacillus sp. 179-K 1B1 HS TaxID=3142388 RepID=UPI0039A1044F